MTEIERVAGESFAVIAAEPTGALNREREVLLVWNRPVPQGDPSGEPALDEAGEEPTQ